MELKFFQKEDLINNCTMFKLLSNEVKDFLPASADTPNCKDT